MFSLLHMSVKLSIFCREILKMYEKLKSKRTLPSTVIKYKLLKFNRYENLHRISKLTLKLKLFLIVRLSTMDISQITFCPTFKMTITLVKPFIGQNEKESNKPWSLITCTLSKITMYMIVWCADCSCKDAYKHTLNILG